MLYKNENLHGGDIYQENIVLDYSVNINPYGTPDEVIIAMKDSLKDIQNYPDPYARELVKAIAEYENVPEEYILCGSGAAELIYSFARSISSKVAVETAPTFSEYALGLNAAGRTRIVRYELDPDKGFKLDDDFITFIKEKEADTVFLCNPNNPTGRNIDPVLMENIAAFCRERSIRLFVDECFLELSDGAEGSDGENLSMKKYLKDYKGLFILKAFTKNFGMAGIRLGYCLCGDQELLKAMSETCQPWNISIPAQAAGTAAVKCRSFIGKAREVIVPEREWLSEKLTELGMTVIPSEANFILFKGPQELGSELRKCGIALRDCSNFENLEVGWYRAAVKLHHENEELISNIARISGK